ncbi:hypothetical protein [Lederbergia lenta]|nr:hypothetical protein [Lederbergia lenta]
MTWEELTQKLKEEMLFDPDEVYELLKALNEIRKVKIEAQLK